MAFEDEEEFFADETWSVMSIVEKAAAAAPWPLYDVRALMERPFFALSSRPRHVPIEYTSPCERWRLKAEPTTALGLSSIRDAEILILLASQLIHEHPKGSPIPAVVSLNPRQLLKTRGQAASGRDYDLLRASLERLQGTRYTTNVQPDGGVGPEHTFALIEDAAFAETRGRLDVTLSEWFRTAVAERRVLQLSEAYLGIRGNYARWLYRVARKHAGDQPDFRMQLSTLWEKSGKGSPLPRFRHELRKVVRANDLPDYGVYWLDLKAEGREPVVTMARRGGAPRPRTRDAILWE